MTKRTQEETLAIASEAYTEIFKIDIDLSNTECISENDLEGWRAEEVLESDNYTLNKTIDSYGGEGQWEEYWFVSKVTVKETGEEILVKFEGYYDSWNGTEWEDIFIVEPKEVKVIKYVAAYKD